MQHPFGRRSFKEAIGDWRWWLASWLSYFACRLRRQKWYVADSWHGVPGNRAGELQQQIWTEAVAQIGRFSDDYQYHEYIESLEPRLNELAQLATADWGHYPQPKEEESVTL